MSKITYDLQSGDEVTSDIMTEIKTVVNENANQSNSYKSYVGRLSYEGVGLYVSTKQFSNLGELTLSNPSAGVIRIVSASNSFKAGKTLLFLGSGRTEFILEAEYGLLPTFLDINIFDLENQQTASPSVNMAFEIRVYD